MSLIPIRIGITILDEIEKVYDDITKRAYERFLERGGAYTLDIEDWLEAERQLLSKPEIELIEKPDLFVVRVLLDLPDPASVDVLATAEDVLIQSNGKHSGPRIFRAVHFPKPVDPLQLHGTYVENKLTLIAPRIQNRKLSALSVC